MKILLSAYACEPNRGSEEGFGWNWSTHLAAQGHQVWTITRPHTRAAVERALAAEPVENLSFIYVDLPRWIRPALSGQFGVYAAYFAWQQAVVGPAAEIVDRFDIDLIHHVTWGTLPGGSRLWTLGRPFVFGPVGGGQVAPAGFERYLPTTGRQEWLRTFLTTHLLPHWPVTRRMVERTDLLLATDTDTLTVADRMGASRARLFLDSGLPAQFYADEPKTEFRDDQLNILWVGRSLEKKALRLSLETVSLLETPFRMTILGDGPQDGLINDWLAELGLEDRVRWKGRVSWEQVRKEFDDHEVMLFTSLRDSFGSQLLEAMGNGVVVATLDQHGARDFVPDDAGIKVPVTTPELTAAALAAALDRLNGDVDVLSSMSSAALGFARRHEWGAKAAEMSELYRSVGSTIPA